MVVMNSSVGDMARAVLRDYAIDLAMGHLMHCLVDHGWTPWQIQQAKPAILAAMHEMVEQVHRDGIEESSAAFDAGFPHLNGAAYAMPFLAAGQAIAESVMESCCWPSDED